MRANEQQSLQTGSAKATQEERWESSWKTLRQTARGANTTAVTSNSAKTHKASKAQKTWAVKEKGGGKDRRRGALGGGGGRRSWAAEEPVLP